MFLIFRYDRELGGASDNTAECWLLETPLPHLNCSSLEYVVNFYKRNAESEYIVVCHVVIDYHVRLEWT